MKLVIFLCVLGLAKAAQYIGTVKTQLPGPNGSLLDIYADTNVNDPTILTIAMSALNKIEKKAVKNGKADFNDYLSIVKIVSAKKLERNGINYHLVLKVRTNNDNLKCFSTRTCGTKTCTVNYYVPYKILSIHEVLNSYECVIDNE